MSSSVQTGVASSAFLLVEERRMVDRCMWLGLVLTLSWLELSKMFIV